ncbi:hypothetical protein K788_00028810 [Paraburkholderia caribensis MBA4]|uniref:Uncharacterized protein n=1 Tax=Paraburkholderia caribensis MBA4 TaxID=1323664 RepID=A0A0P0RDD1_9BURK|nr:hypothetical protein K788_00028810 [Paraburkholderia caribensis MBA4]
MARSAPSACRLNPQFKSRSAVAATCFASLIYR